MIGDQPLPPTLEANPRLGDWLRIGADGTVEVRSGKVELGQGVLTALAQMAAEELDVDVGRIQMTAAATDLSPDEGMTAGSLSIQQSGAALREVCAEARDLYLTIAAHRLAVPKEDLTVTDGRIVGSDGAQTSYWELADDAVLNRRASGGAKPKPDSDYRVVGTDVARIDLADKLSGRPRYVHDLQPDGMVYGRVVHPPSRGATLTSVDTGQISALPGVIAVVREGDFLAVVAEREELALRAQERLRGDAEWHQQPTLPDEADLSRFLTEAAAETTNLTAGMPPDEPSASHVCRHLPSTVHRARVHRSVVRRRAGGRRRTPDLVAQPGCAHPAPRDRARAVDGARAGGGPPRRRRGLLRPQRCRRRRDGRRDAGARSARSAGSGGVVTSRRTGLGAAGYARAWSAFRPGSRTTAP